MHETWGRKNGSAAVGGNMESLGEQRRRPRELKYTAGTEMRGAKRAEKNGTRDERGSWGS